jgi:hypothetical protein
MGRGPEANVAFDGAGLLVAGGEDVGFESAAAVRIIDVIGSREPEAEDVIGHVARRQTIGLTIDAVVGSALCVLKEAVSLPLQGAEPQTKTIADGDVDDGLQQTLTMVADARLGFQPEGVARHLLENGNAAIQSRAAVQSRLRPLLDLDAVDVEHLAVGGSDLGDRNPVLEQRHARFSRRRGIVRRDASQRDARQQTVLKLDHQSRRHLGDTVQFGRPQALQRRAVIGADRHRHFRDSLRALLRRHDDLPDFRSGLGNGQCLRLRLSIGRTGPPKHGRRQ